MSTPVENYDAWSRAYWKNRCLDAERDLERVMDELDSANEFIAHLKKQRESYMELREDGLTGRTYWQP